MRPRIAFGRGRAIKSDARTRAHSESPALPDEMINVPTMA